MRGVARIGGADRDPVTARGRAEGDCTALRTERLTPMRTYVRMTTDPAPWLSSAPGPWVTMARTRGIVEVWARDGERHLVRSTGEIEFERVVEGHDAAQRLAVELAERLG